MNRQLTISASPHIHSSHSTAGIMGDVLLSLLPATVAGAFIFGPRALLVVAVCVASCIGFEFLFNMICKKEQTVTDLSAAVTGLLLALNLPAGIPLWQCITGSLFAIVVVKCLFGGLGCNLVNPAITARVFMLVSFGTMTVQSFPRGVDTVAGATPLVMIASGNPPALRDLLLGLTGGAIGETCAIALLLGFVYLLCRRVITWHVPLSFIGVVYLLSFFLEGCDPLAALSLVLSGGLLIGAIFMATDYVTSPITKLGQIVYGIGCGVLTILIRYFGGYNEGVSYAILVMNCCVVLLDRIGRPTKFGAPKKEAAKK